MNESGVWQYVKKGMEGRWHATRLESSAGNGVPDVDFGLPGIAGKIELKYQEFWPKRDNTLVRLPLRPEQRLWIRTRGKLHGNIWVIFRVDDDFFILDWGRAEHACDGWTRAQWNMLSYFHWEKRIDFTQLHRILKGELSDDRLRLQDQTVLTSRKGLLIIP